MSKVYQQMANSSSGMEHLAVRLLELELPQADAAHGQMDHLLQAFAKIRAPLVKLAGSAGFNMLLARAVALASKKEISLVHLRVEIDGSLSGLDEVRRAASNGNGSEQHARDHGGAIILAELLGLLISFVGESLALALVREAWPDAHLDRNTNITEDQK